MKINSDKVILIWHWDDAPAELKALSHHGGDEDWLAVMPLSYKDNLPMWMKNSSFGCCDVSKEVVTNDMLFNGEDFLLVIGAHA